MDESGLAAVAKFVMRDRQHLGVLRVREGVITLEQLHFADEIRPIDELKPSKARVDKGELDMALRLIDSFTGHWQPEQYEDTYRDELMAVIEAKRKGREVHAAAEVEEGEELPDLMTALRESIEHSTGRRRPRKRAAAKRSTAKRSRAKRAV